jgi:Polysaccharide lyase
MRRTISCCSISSGHGIASAASSALFMLTAITGATSSTYVPVSLDVGSMLKVSVTATSGGVASNPATSLPTATVIAVASTGVPVLGTPPVISGTPQAGQPLTASSGSWSNCGSCTYAYTWNSAAPTPDITGFNSVADNSTNPVGSRFSQGAYPSQWVTENAMQPWSIANPDSQTLVFQVQNGDTWSADVGAPTPKNRSEVRLGTDPPFNIFPVGQEVNVSYNFEMLSTTLRTDTNWMTIGQFHNDDTAMGQHTSPPIELDLQPTEFMSIYIGYLTASPAPSNCTFLFSQTLGGYNISYCQAYLDPNPITRQHNYKIQIQVKATGVGDNTGFLKVWRDGTQIVNSAGQIGFGFNTNWDYGIYRHASTETQTAQYQNMMVAARPLVLGTASSYTPVAGDVGNSVSVTVVATNGTGSSAPVTVPLTTPIAPAGAIVAPSNTGFQ